MFSTLTEKMPCTKKFLTWILPRGLIMILVLVVGLVVISNTPRVETGIVECKLVTGKNEHRSHILLVSMDRQNIPVAETMKGIVHSNYEGTSIDQALEDEISKYYTDIQYSVAFRLVRNNTLKNFNVRREIFNVAETDSIMKFEIERPYSNEVTRVITNDSRMLAVDSNYPQVTEFRHIMYQ
jgi:hypothetical protein